MSNLNLMYKFLKVLLFTILITGCAVASGPKYDTLAPLISDKYSTLIVYRVPSLKGAAWPHNIYIDGTLIAKLGSGGITRLLVSPGSHTVSQGPEKDPTFREVETNFIAGETYYVEHDPGHTVLEPGSFRFKNKDEVKLANYSYQLPIAEVYPNEYNN